MDLSAVLAYKSLFLANRAKGTVEQMENGQKCTALANGVRCAVTTSQAAVPLFTVSECLAQTAKNQGLKQAAGEIAGSNLKHIAETISSKSTTQALNNLSGIMKFLTKLGIISNVAYAAAKCIDAPEDKKNETLLKATGNLAGMYAFEKMYSKIVSNISPDDIVKQTKNTKDTLLKLQALKTIKPLSVLIGIGFVCASLYGCKVGEEVGEKIYNSYCKKQNSENNLKYTA